MFVSEWTPLKPIPRHGGMVRYGRGWPSLPTNAYVAVTIGFDPSP